MRPEESDTAHVWDMWEATREALSFLSGVSREQFLASPVLTRAVERDLEIVGEAARRVSQPFREYHPEIPWRDVIGQRNFLAHEYGDVIPERVWETATEDLPKLLGRLEALLFTLDDPSPGPE